MTSWFSGLLLSGQVVERKTGAPSGTWRGSTAIERLAVNGTPKSVVIGSLAIIISLAWAYMFFLAWDMSNMNKGMEMTMPAMETNCSGTTEKPVIRSKLRRIRL